MLFDRQGWIKKVAAIQESPGEIPRAQATTVYKESLIGSTWALYNDCKNSTGEIRQWYNFFSFMLQNGTSSNSQLAQDLWVLYETRGKRNGVFVEFGAIDGIRLSNTLLLERSFDWKGIACEPYPEMFNHLKANRKCKVDSRCVHSSTGEHVDFKCTANPELASILNNEIEKDQHHAKRVDHEITKVETVSLTDLLQQHNMPNFIDYLSIDTEGSEYIILEKHDFSRYTFGLITVEHNGRSDRQQIHALLSSKGYFRKFAGFSQFDDWYIHEALGKNF